MGKVQVLLKAERYINLGQRKVLMKHLIFSKYGYVH